MRRSILFFVLVGCGGNAKDSALPTDSGLEFPDGTDADDGNDDDGSVDDADDGGDAPGGDGGSTGATADGGDETGGGSDDADDGGSGDETGGEEGGDESGDDSGSAEDDCTDAPIDLYEPNDEEGDAEDFGDQDGEEFEITGGYLYPDTDVDRYTFSVKDGWLDGLDIIFDLQVRLTGVPTTADLKLDLYYLTDSDGEPVGELVASADEAAAGGEEAVSFGGIWDEITSLFADRGGQYEIVVSSNDGSSCTSPYTLTVVADTR